MKNQKKRFKFIDLNESNLTPDYILKKGSSLEFYFARLKNKKESNLYSVNGVYKKVLKNGEEIKNEIGETFVEEVFSGKAFNSLCWFYNGKPLEESMSQVSNQKSHLESLEDLASDENDESVRTENQEHDGIRALEKNPIYQNHL